MMQNSSQIFYIYIYIKYMIYMYRSWHQIYLGHRIWKHPSMTARPLRLRWRPYTWVVRSATGEVLRASMGSWCSWDALHGCNDWFIGKWNEFHFNLETEEIVEIRGEEMKKVCNASMRVGRFHLFFVFLSCERQIVATVRRQPPSKLSESLTNGTAPSQSPTTLWATESHAFFSMTPIEYGCPPQKINTAELT